MRIVSAFRAVFRRSSTQPAAKVRVGAPTAPGPGAAQKVRSLGRGIAADGLYDRLAGQPAAHVDAVLHAFARAQRVLDRKGRRATVPWSQVHLVHVQFAPGTRNPDALRLPVGARGTQLGAAYCVRGHKGHLHAYAMVWLPEAARR